MRAIFTGVTYAIVALFFLTMTTIALCQTEYGKNKLKSFLIQNFKDNGIEISFSKFSGIIPLEFRLEDIRIKTKTTNITIEKAKFRPLYLRFFKKEIAFEAIHLQKVRTTFIKDTPVQEQISSFENLPYSLQIKHFSIKDVILSDYPDLSLNLKGSFNLSKNLDIYSSKISIKRDSDSLYVKVDAKRLKPLQIDIKGNFKNLAPFFEQDAIDDLSFHITAGGDKKTFLTSVINSSLPALSGRVSASMKSPFITERIKSTISSNFIVDKASEVFLNNIYVNNSIFTLKGKATLPSTAEIKDGSFTLDTSDLKKLFPKVSGQLKGVGIFNYKNSLASIDLIYNSKQIVIDGQSITNISGKANTLINKEAIFSNVNMDSTVISQQWNLKTNIVYPYAETVSLKNIHLISDLGEVNGNLTIDDTLDGQLSGSFSNLAFIEEYIPTLRPDGKTSIDIEFFEENGKQNISIKAAASRVYMEKAYSEKVLFDLSIKDAFTDPLLSLGLIAQNGSYANLHIDTLMFDTAYETNNWPYRLTIEGKWKDPLTIESRGFWHYSKDDLMINIQDLTGSMFTHNFISPEPIQFLWKQDHLKLTDIKISMPDSSLYAQADIDKSTGNLKLDIEHFPIEFITLFKPEIDLSGFFSLKSTIDRKGSTLTGKADLTVHDITSFADGIIPSGRFKATLDKQKMTIIGDLKANDITLFDLNAHIPVIIDPSSLSFSIIKNKPIDALFSYNGKIEKFLDFFDLGSHFLAGELQANIKVKNSLNNLDIKGVANLTNGTYENYYTGTYLKDISANIIADDQKVTLTKLTAIGPNQGTFLTTATLNLSHNDQYPFIGELEFEDLLLAQFIYGDATGRAKLNFSGDRKQAQLTGRVKIKQANLNIPNSLPTEVPDLSIRYIHPLPIVNIEPKEHTPIYPFYLDLLIDAPENVYIRGKGVDSNWGGSFDIVGRVDEIIPKGKLDLQSGTFTFSSKVFHLTNGTLSFPGMKDTPPFIELSGELTERGTTIIGSLQGPLNKPKLDFRSIPPLAISQILSLILFGQELNEITGFQAVQLAALVASLSSDSPTILESTRKSLGIDRLNVVSVPTKGDDEALSLQVGKYIAKGVLVTITQGAGPNQSDVGVEVDLSHGFSFTAATEQQLEQGKFALKWNYTY